MKARRQIPTHHADHTRQYATGTETALLIAGGECRGRNDGERRTLGHGMTQLERDPQVPNSHAVRRAHITGAKHLELQVAREPDLQIEVPRGRLTQRGDTERTRALLELGIA